jgi:hypothetical protein
MRNALLLCCLLLNGCATAELTSAGAHVGITRQAQEGCRLVETRREAEGGGFRSLEDNAVSVQTTLRNRAAWLGGDTVVVVDTVTDPYHMPSGVPGLMTPNPPCSNCVTMTARIYSCGAAAPPIAPEPPVCPGLVPPPEQDDDGDETSSLAR